MSVKSSELHRDETGVAPHPEAQFEKLVEVISRSQSGYRELIDNLDQAVFTLSTDGEVRVANRYLADLLGVAFNELIGHSLAEFLDEPTLAQAAQHLPSLLRKGSWSGVIPVRLKKGGSPATSSAGCSWAWRGSGVLPSAAGPGMSPCSAIRKFASTNFSSLSGGDFLLHPGGPHSGCEPGAD